MKVQMGSAVRNILCVCGPQGSGNHLWSKIFSSHKDVCGWEQLTKKYWVGHAKEPFHDTWLEPKLLYDRPFKDENYFTNTSVPFGGHVYGDKMIPKIKEFIETLKDLGFNVQVGVTSRDKNILKLQQERRWKEETTPEFLDLIDQIENPIFLNYESLLLYREKYVKSLNINIPIDYNSISKNIQVDQNQKYICNFKPSPLRKR